MLRVRRSCFDVHSDGASVASAHAQSALKLCNSPIIGRIKKLFSKKHSFVYREIQFRKKSKIGDQKILILVYL